MTTTTPTKKEQDDATPEIFAKPVRSSDIVCVCVCVCVCERERERGQCVCLHAGKSVCMSVSVHD